MKQRIVLVALGVVAAAALLGETAAPARAAVLDAVYHGTLVCDRLPFSEAQMREAIEVTVANGTVAYRQVVRLHEVAEMKPEEGTGTLNGQDITLQGSWKDKNRSYEAKYSGSFVRRSARLKGTQTWTDGSRTVTRACGGAIKRPLKAFLPRKKKLPAQ
jgi:hypothetical protein